MLTAFDVGVGVLVLISAILATARGLTREVLSLATWAGSAAIAIYMWQYHPEIGRGFIRDPNVADIATVVVTFIVALIVLHLITMRIADFVVDSRIGPLDRTLGFIFGLARGILIAVVLVIFGTWLLPDLDNQSWARESKSIPPLRDLGTRLIQVLPPDLEKLVTDTLEGRTGAGADSTAETPPPEDETTDGPEDDSPMDPPPPAANRI